MLGAGFPAAFPFPVQLRAAGRPGPASVRCALWGDQAAAAVLGTATLPRFRPLLNETHQDSLGVGWVAVDAGGHITAELVGFGTRAVTQGCVDSCIAGIEKVNARPRTVQGFFDLRRGYGCSPMAVPALVAFLRDYGDRFARVAVVATGAPLRIAQVVASAARFRDIGFFSSPSEARAWLEAA